ncbi:MAG: polysaccharide deacetylase family protein [Clostridia bacterium]|nr:polysaccharide deacetylase family protein [Clostridia bacterium]
MDKKFRVFRNIGVNFVIVFMLGFLCVLTINNDVRSVFNPSLANVVYRGNESQNNVSLMINVYWGNEYLPSMLKNFDNFGVKTTFFVGGMWVSKYPEELINLSNKGHEIGNHGFFHKDHDKLNYQDNQKEIMNTHKLVKQYIGQEMTLFAPPSGAFNNDTLNSADDLGYQVIMWSRDTIDWRDQDANLIYERATKKLSNGELVLMHPTLKTAEALPRILQYCKDNNLNVVPVSSALLA